MRAVEDAAGLPHGSVRHHFGARRGLLIALFDHLERLESPTPPGSTAAGQAPVDAVSGLLDAIEGWIGPGRTVALARYELFLLAARDAELRAPLVRARERFVAQAQTAVGAERAPGVVAAIDGLVLDALVRGQHDRTALRATVSQLLRP